MKKFIFEQICKFFPSQVENLRSISFSKGQNTSNNEQISLRKSYQTTELSLFVGQPVIIISNEWENPIIGFGHSIEFITKAQNPVLLVEDALTGDVFMTMGKPFVFTQQRFDAIMKLTPFELGSLLYSNAYFDCTFEKAKRGHRDTHEELLQKLKNVQFFEKVEQIVKVED